MVNIRRIISSCLGRKRMIQFVCQKIIANVQIFHFTVTCEQIVGAYWQSSGIHLTKKMAMQSWCKELCYDFCVLLTFNWLKNTISAPKQKYGIIIFHKVFEWSMLCLFLRNQSDRWCERTNRRRVWCLCEEDLTWWPCFQWWYVLSKMYIYIYIYIYINHSLP